MPATAPDPPAVVVKVYFYHESIFTCLSLQGFPVLDEFLFIEGDCREAMKSLSDCSVDTWITSPPYAMQRDYIGASPNDYADWITPVFHQAWRTLKDSGSLFFNIKEHCENGQRDLYIYKLIPYVVEVLGWRLVDEFIWHKTNPFPTGGQKRLKDGFERIFHFTKTENYKFYPDNCLIYSESKWLESEKRRSNKGQHNTTNNSGMNMSKRIAADLVRPSNVLQMSSSNLNIEHPATFPLRLPEFFISLSTMPGDTVGDMFLGSGSTAIAATRMHRKTIGIEIDNKFYNLAVNRYYQETRQQAFNF